MQKKSQVMIFVILGVVMVFIILLMFLLVTNGKKSTPTEDKIDDAFILKEIKSCMDSKLKYAILTSGKQGGKIYQPQGGKAPLLGQFLNYYDSYFIPYYLPYYSPRDFYGSGNLYFPYDCSKELEPNYSVPFDGLNPFEHFELKSGCQRSNATSLVLNIPTIDSDLSEQSFKSQILYFLEENIEECYEIDSQIYPYEAEVEETPKINLIISEREIVLEVQNSIKIKKNNVLLKEIVSPINIVAKIRLREHYDFLKELLYDELKNASFNPSLAGRDGFSVSVLRDVNDNPYHNDVIIVKDLKSYIDGENFEIWVARTNNYPIISYSPSQISLTSQEPFIKPLEIGIPASTILEILDEYNEKYTPLAIDHIYDENTFNKLEHNFSEFLINGIQDKSGIFTVYDREEDLIITTNKTNFTHFGLPFEVNITACENHDYIENMPKPSPSLCVESRFLFNMIADVNEEGALEIY